MAYQTTQIIRVKVAFDQAIKQRRKITSLNPPEAMEGYVQPCWAQTTVWS